MKKTAIPKSVIFSVLAMVVAASLTLIPGFGFDLLGRYPCARHLDVNPADWTFHKTDPKGMLSDQDIGHIINAVGKIPDIDHRIISIEAISPTEVEVYTGYIKGPLNGGGNVVTIVRDGRCWNWLDSGSIVSTWIS